MENEPFVDKNLASEFVGISPRQLLDYARQGVVRGYALGERRKRWRFLLTELAEDIKTLKYREPKYNVGSSPCEPED